MSRTWSGFVLAVISTLGGVGIGRVCAQSVEDAKFWPEQRTPKGIVTVSSIEFESMGQPRADVNSSADHMLTASLAGLAAKAVNEGRFDEMVYIHLWNNRDYAIWRDMLLERTGVKDLGDCSPWELVERWKDKGVFDGYLLYTWDRSAGSMMTCRDGMSESVNVAASLAGPLRGLLICEEQEEKAKALGLKKLADVRDKTEQWAFDTYKDRFDRKRVLLQDPASPNNRAVAIAHNILTIYGEDELTSAVYQWMDAPGMVLGWNCGDEGAFVQELSRWGHVISASNWAINLPALSIGASSAKLPHLHHGVVPGAAQDKPVASFMISDGDNLQWALGGFATSSAYWANPNMGRFPVSFSLPLADLVEAAPDPYRYFQATQPESVSVATAAGYWYPDRLGEALPDEKRMEVLRFQGRRIERTIRATGADSIMLLCMDFNDAWTSRALDILVEEAPSLRYGVVLQYSPYEAGEGRVYIARRDDGAAVPFISAAYALWKDNPYPRADTPSNIAKMLKERLKSGEKFPIWITVHAWSTFTDLPDPMSGVSASAWCSKLIDDVYRLATNDEVFEAIKPRLGEKSGWVTPQ